MIRVLLALAVFVLAILAVAQWKANEPENPAADHEQLYNEFLAELMWRSQEYATWFVDGELESLHDQFTFEMKLLTPLGDLIALKERVTAELGDELRPVQEGISAHGENFVYDRISEYDSYESGVQMLITLNDDQKILGFTIQPVLQNQDQSSGGDDS